MERRKARRGIVPVLLCASVLIASAGCGTGSVADPGSGNPTPTAEPGRTSSANGGTTLTIVVDDGGGAVVTWRLTCNPSGGDHPQPQKACRALADHGARALPAVPRDRTCAQVVDGPQVATVTGTWSGEQVDSHFSRRNACETARWDALTGLLPAVDR